jgi:hypothetical protein
MSRTRHHNKINESIRNNRKKLIEFRQKHLKKLNFDDWYIEIPASKQFNARTLLRK